MPQLGETVTEGTVTRWLKAVGDTVARDEPLFEVSTDKVDSEVPSPAAGVLAQILVPEGETADVGAVLAVVSDDGTAGAPSAPSAPSAERAAPAHPAPAPTPPPVGAVEAAAPPPAPAAPTPAAPTPAAPTPAAPAVPTPPPPRAPTPPPPAAAVPPTPPAPAGEEAGPSPRLLSPVVRKLLDEHGISPDEVTGSGIGGRITRADVLAVIDARRAGGAPAPATRVVPGPPPPPAPAPAPAHGPGPTPDEVIPFTNIRRRTAEHMVRSKATSAHTLVVKETDYERVEQVRREHGPRFRVEEGFSLTYLPFVARATVEALREWPHLNASVGEDALIVHRDVNIGVAVDLDHNGLIVPVVRRAEELTLRGLARRVHDLADRARTKRLGADDIAGGTFSITNAGPYGTFLTAPIINQPQVAILSTDGVKRRPVVVTAEDGTEAIAVHSVGLLCLSWDHRAVDGAYAAAFVARVAEILGTHDWAAEL